MELELLVEQINKLTTSEQLNKDSYCPVAVRLVEKMKVVPCELYIKISDDNFV